MSRRVKELLADIVNLEIELSDQVKSDYPIGAPIQWKSLSANASARTGRVIDHGYRDRIKVRNEKTGSEFWITAPRIE